jgi:hypothetical protein
MNLKQWCWNNWYTLKYDIDFEIDRYWDWNVSITTLLKILYDSSFEYVLRNHKEAVDKACKEWTRIHKQAEDFYTKWSWVNQINKNFMMFHSLYNTEVIWQEQTFINDWVRWTIDVICSIDGKEYNIDYKNTNIHSAKYCLQLWWYKYLNGNNWILVYGKWKLKVVEVEDYYLDLFIELKQYFFNLLNKKKWIH